MDKDISLYEPDSVSTITMNDYQILKKALENIVEMDEINYEAECRAKSIAQQALDEVNNLDN